MKPGHYILLGFGIAAAILLGYLMGRHSPWEPHGGLPEPRVDTLVIRDTISVTEAKYVTRRVVDSVLVPVHDTTRLRDTLYVFLEREQVRWEDSLAVVYASGINTQVDSVIHYTRDQIIVKEIPVIQVKKTKWGIGLQAGATVDNNGLVPYIGVGISYNVFSW